MAAMEAGPVPATLAQEDAARDASEAAGAGPEAPLLPAGNRLSLHLHPGGCRRLLRLCAQQAPQLLEVDFLQLSGHEDPQLLEAALARLPWSLPRLRSLVLKGGQRREALGACLRGSLATLPASLSSLARLAHLDLSFNSLETLPACVPQMCGLDALLLSRNCLSELPAALGALPALTFLAVTHNRLRTLPPALGALSSLQRLDLSGNLLEALPPEIGGLGSLAELNLASNRLQSLPSSLATSWLRCPPAWPASRCSPGST